MSGWKGHDSQALMRTLCSLLGLLQVWLQKLADSIVATETDSHQSACKLKLLNVKCTFAHANAEGLVLPRDRALGARGVVACCAEV